MGIICDTCGRDIDALGQDNMGVDAPLCEDCWGEQQSHTVAVPRREARNLRFENARRERGGEGRGNGRGAGQEPARGHEAGHADGGGVAMEQQTEKPKRRPSIEVRCPKCGMREIWHHLPKGGDRCRWCGHLFEDFTYRKVGPSAKEGAR